MEVNEEVKIPKRRGRPPKNKEQQEELKFNPDAIKTLLNFIFTALARKLGDHWELQPDELETLTSAWDSFLKENAKFLTKNFTTINFVLVNGLIIVPRILHRKNEKQDNSNIRQERDRQEQSGEIRDNTAFRTGDNN